MMDRWRCMFFWLNAPEWWKPKNKQINTHVVTETWMTMEACLYYRVSHQWWFIFMPLVTDVQCPASHKKLFQRCMYQPIPNQKCTCRITETCTTQEVCLYYRVQHQWWYIFMPLVTDVQYPVNHQKSIVLRLYM